LPSPSLRPATTTRRTISPTLLPKSRPIAPIRLRMSPLSHRVRHAPVAAVLQHAYADSALAEYQLRSAPVLGHGHAAPRAGGVTAAWLEVAVQEAVRHIGASVAHGCSGPAQPFLLLGNPRPGAPFETVPLGEMDLAGGWAGVAAQVGSATSLGMLLVQPMPEGEGEGGEAAGGCVASQLQRTLSASSGGGGAAGDGCRECAAVLAAAQAQRGGARTAAGGPESSTLIAGRIGDCCGGDAAGQAAAAAATAAPAAEAATAPPSCAIHSGGRPAFYGVVVQGPHSATPDGCYLLKTTHAASAVLGCTCSHYVLTRVSKGPSLHQQLTRSWTV
jgi:hypothetical protein